MNKTVLEYLEGYFDGQLNESISDDNIMEAFAELIETANAVEEYMDEAFPRKVTGRESDAASHAAFDKRERDGERDPRTIDQLQQDIRRQNKGIEYQRSHDKIDNLETRKRGNVPMLRIPAGASTTPKPMSIASKIRKLIGRRK